MLNIKKLNKKNTSQPLGAFPISSIRENIFHSYGILYSRILLVTRVYTRAYKYVIRHSPDFCLQFVKKIK